MPFAVCRRVLPVSLVLFGFDMVLINLTSLTGL